MTDAPQSNASATPSLSAVPQNHSLLTYYLGILQRRIWIIIPLVIMGTTIGLIRSMRQPRIYRGTARLLVETQVPGVMGFERGNADAQGWDIDYYETQQELVRSRAVLDIALEEPEVGSIIEMETGGPGGSKIFRELRRSLLAVLGATPAPLAEPWELLQERIQARHLAETHFLDVSATSLNSVNAARLANAAAHAFEAYHRLTREESLGDAFVKLERERDKEELAMIESEQALQEFRETAQGVTVGGSGANQPAIDRLNTINHQLTQVQLNRIELESQIAVMEKAMKADDIADGLTSRLLFALPVIKTDEGLTDARRDLAAAQKDRSMLAQTYGAAHPLLQAATSKSELLLEQFQTGLADVVAAERNRYTMLGREEAELERQYGEQKASALELAREDFMLTRLQNSVDRHRQLYDSLVARMREVDVSTGLIQTNVRIVQRAEPPHKPANAGRGRSVAVSLIISLLLGIGLAFLFENLDDTVKTPEDLKERLSVPLLGFVPSILTEAEQTAQEGAPQRDIVKDLVKNLKTSIRDRLFVLRPDWFAKPDVQPTASSDAERRHRGMMVVNESISSVAEAYRGIRTSLFYSVPANTVKTLALTSCRPQEGKTTTCCNLALSIAQTGKHVLLIDGDLHRPMIHRTLGVERAIGLTSVLVGECVWSEAINRVEIDAETDRHLDVMTAGPISPNPSELLGSARMKEFIEEVQRDYDWVIIDTPPILFVSDASVMSVLCDGVIMVVKSGTSTRTLLNRAREQLDSVSANILGSILNNVLVSRMGRHSSSYYNYGYSRYAKDYKSLYYASEDSEPVAAEPPVVVRVTPPPTPSPGVVSDSEPGIAGPASPEPSPQLLPDVRPPEPAPASRYELQLRKAERLARAGQTDRARELIESILALDDTDIPTREAMIKLELDAGKTEVSARLSQALLADDPNNPYALYVLGSLDIVSGDYQSAEARLRESVERRPHAESLNNLGWLINEMGRAKEAEAYVRRALETDAKVHNAWDTLGLILLKQDRTEEAATAFETALHLDSNDICAILNTAEIRVRQGRLRPARKLLRKLAPRLNQLIATERDRYENLKTLALNS
ncbi:MAG: polysaccharide biosynthesis tyrosine autokinase [Lentisphaerae bacterium]|nr:polysaccharide biosynthesis tyrosine autokinase [Lentisphaerota bacterium]